jgi:hypothetical protein
MLFTSTMPTHAEKNRGRRVLFPLTLKRAKQYRRFLPVSCIHVSCIMHCMIAQRAAGHRPQAWLAACSLAYNCALHLGASTGQPWEGAEAEGADGRKRGRAWLAASSSAIRHLAKAGQLPINKPPPAVLTGCSACGYAARSSLRSRRPSGPKTPI